MKLVRGIFSLALVFILCCSALFLFILTASGILFGIYDVLLNEPELNGIFFTRTAEQLATEIVICCIWIFGFGKAFSANVAILRRIVKK